MFCSKGARVPDLKQKLITQQDITNFLKEFSSQRNTMRHEGYLNGRKLKCVVIIIVVVVVVVVVVITTIVDNLTLNP